MAENPTYEELQNRIEEHTGSVSLESESNIGTRVIITFPAAVEEGSR